MLNVVVAVVIRHCRAEGASWREGARGRAGSGGAGGAAAVRERQLPEVDIHSLSTLQLSYALPWPLQVLSLHPK